MNDDLEHGVPTLNRITTLHKEMLYIKTTLSLEKPSYEDIYTSHSARLQADLDFVFDVFMLSIYAMLPPRGRYTPLKGRDRGKEDRGARNIQHVLFINEHQGVDNSSTQTNTHTHTHTYLISTSF